MKEENKKPIGLIFFIISFMVLSSGCLGSDYNGMISAKASYDNLHLKTGYKILDHTSDYVCCVEYRYFVSYMIESPNGTVFWLHGFIYWGDEDKLVWSPSTSMIQSDFNGEEGMPDYIISIN
jgi:hypothetical protein